MRQEQKDLLKKVLCEMLPYGVKIRVNTQKNNVYTINCYEESDYYDDGYKFDAHCSGMMKYGLKIEDFKPYLRPMSSMTEEEKKELWAALDEDMSILDSIFDAPIINEYKGRVYRGNPVHYELDFLISHYFDYRGLIPMGLALEAPVDMYKNK